ncbi:hypothetical protein [Bacterioplanoides sp.]|uniref:hypothetical protein n=1 Tax=Bacterioplanoides sp. TaxID=2066072 RepID=UPI003B5CD240
MSIPDFLIPINLTLQLQQQVSQLGDYDDPCFVSVCTSLDSDAFGGILDQCSYDADLELEDFMTIESETEQDRLFYFSLDGDYGDIGIFAEALAAQLEAYKGYVSVFRHNPIGEPQETLFWCWVQLQRLIESPADASRVAINDFTDRQRWPGLSGYPDFWQAKQAAELSAAKQNKGGFLKGVAQGIVRGLARGIDAAIFGDKSKTHNDGQKINAAAVPEWQKMADELWPLPMQSGLKPLAPFIFHLPNGEALWRYVLTGEGRESLYEQNHLLDLDSVLIFAHAQDYAPEFYRQLDTCLRGVSEQADILDDLREVLEDLSEELLEASGYEHERQSRVDCFLRVLDIFFHLLDQQTPETDMFELLVEEQQCLSREAYRQRYRVAEQVEEGCISEEQAKALKNIIRGLKRFYTADYDELKAIRELRLESRAVADVSLWDIEHKPHELLLVAIMLANDHADGINYEYHQSAQKLFDEHFISKSLKSLSKYYDGENQDIETWLNSDGSNVELLETAVKQLRDGLELSSYRGRRDVAQPPYECLDSNSKFAPMLVSAYFRLQVCSYAPAARLLELFLRLAPQKTLDWCSRLYRDGFRGFVDSDTADEFERSLENIEATPSDRFVFMQRLYAKCDAERYQQHIQHYLNSDKETRLKLDQSVSRLFVPHQQRFYFDVWLADEQYQPAVSDLWRDAFAAIHQQISLMDDDVFAAMFDKKQILFADRGEYLPEDLNLDIRISDNTRNNPCWHGAEQPPRSISYAVLRYQNDYLELLLEAPGADFKTEQYLGVNNLVVLDSAVTNEQLDEVLSQLADIYKSGLKTDGLIAEALDLFIAGELSFSDYHSRIQYLVDAKEYDFVTQNQSPYAARLLTAIRMENNRDRQLRLIKALTLHPIRGPKLRDEIALRLYLDQACRRGEVARDDLNVLELRDLSRPAREGVRETLAQIQQALIQL